jgi:hypothetical protein
MRSFTVTACLLLLCAYAHAFVPAPASFSAPKLYKSSCLQQHRYSVAFVLQATEDDGEQPSNEVNNTNAADDAARQAAENVRERMVHFFTYCLSMFQK